MNTSANFKVEKNISFYLKKTYTYFKTLNTSLKEEDEKRTTLHKKFFNLQKETVVEQVIW